MAHTFYTKHLMGATCQIHALTILPPAPFEYKAEWASIFKVKEQL
jgi:hypothetical protein